MKSTGTTVLMVVGAITILFGQGPRLAAGQTGATRATGSTGETGATGPQRPPASQGTGSQRNEGSPGGPSKPATLGQVDPAGQSSTGQTGATGAIARGTGATGATGVPGPTGAVGKTGAVGMIGPTGPQGPVFLGTGGRDGTGATGFTGSAGPPGATGYRGPQGYEGIPGAPGRPGASAQVDAEEYCRQLNCEQTCEVSPVYKDGQQSYQAFCVCRIGRRNQRVANGTSCADVGFDCNDRNGGCEQICVPSNGRVQAHCSCRDGFYLGASATDCVDINECTEQSSACQTGQRCINEWGHFLCISA